MCIVMSIFLHTMGTEIWFRTDGLDRQATPKLYHSASDEEVITILAIFKFLRV